MSGPTHAFQWRMRSSILRVPALSRVTAAATREAEALLRKAVDVAHGQGATSLELRAATALVRLCDDEAARARLAALVAPFAEGRGGPDLQEARGVLTDS